MNANKIIFALVIGTLATSGGIYLSGCGPDASPSDSAANNAGTTSAASVGGSVQGSDSGATAYYPLKKENFLINFGNQFFGLQEAQAASTVCSLANQTCTSGVVTTDFAGCTSKNGRVTFSGGFTLTLGGGYSCPGSGFWKTFFTTPNATLWRTYKAGTSSTNVDGYTVTSDNTAPTGWDSAVTLSQNSTYSQFGLLRKTVTAPASSATTFTSNQNLMNYGVAHVATGKTKKDKTVTLWDHTISYSGNGLNVAHTYDSTAGTDQKVISSADATSLVIVQHNLAKWTGKSSFTNLTFVHGASNYCGCFPISGTINTAYNGSKTGFEQMTFNYATTNVCGSYTIQGCSDQTCSSLVGTPTSNVLNHCL